MTGKNRLFSLIAVFTVISMVIVGVALVLLYSSAFEQQQARLIDTVKGQASLIRAVARYDRKAAPKMSAGDPAYDPLEATLSQLRDAFLSYEGIGKTGEFILARREGDRIVFLLHHRHLDLEILNPVSISSPEAEPMGRALRSESGVMVGLDYRGEQVLAAYEPVVELGLGIVAKIDLKEIRAPFIRAGLITGGIAIVLITIGAILFFRIGNPMVRELIEKEAMLWDITSTIPGCVYQLVLHRDGSISIPYMSETIKDITGVESGILTKDATKIYDYVHHDEHVEFRESIMRSAEHLTTWDHEFRIVAPDRGTVWLHGKANPQRLPDGSTLWNGVLTDITERNRTVEELRGLYKHNQLILETVGEGIYGLNLDGNTTFVNPEAARMIGWEPKEILGKNQHKLLHHTKPDGTPYPANSCPIYSAYKDGHIHRVSDEIFWRKDGSSFPVEYVSTPIRNENGAIEGAVVTFRDITERKQAEEELRQSEKRFRTAISEAPMPIMIHAEDGEVLHISKVWTSITGYTHGDIPTIDEWTFRAYGQKMENVKATIDAGFERGAIVRDGVFEIRTASGAIRIWDFLSGPLGELSDGRRLLISMATDITEMQRLQKLESRAERLETAGMIAGQVAHDFNNLLAPLMAYPDIIREELPENHPALHYVSQIEKAAQIMTDINQDLLVLGRRGHYNQNVLNLNSIVKQALSDLEPHPETLVCKVDFSDDLMDILGGSAQLHRMISNLLHNAKDAMQDVGRLTIKTENYYIDDDTVVYGRIPKGEFVKLTITDTGCGIPDDIVQKIFDPFFTAKTTDKKRGSGLGLSVVDAVVKDHNGYIDLNTIEGEGTSFYIYIPITRESKNSQDSDKICSGNESILIVDDDDIQREVCSRLLTKLGYKVCSVESGQKAVESLRACPQDLVILDMIMPDGIDGTETYRQVLEINPLQKAIILSGFSETDRVFEAQKLGAGAFVLKPVTKSVLAAAVRTELDRKVEFVTA